MDESKKGALRKHHQRLQTGLLVGNILPVFRTVFTYAEYSRIRDREDNPSRVDEFIDVLLTKENRHFDAFCVALEENGYAHWAKTLQKEVEKLEASVAHFLETYEDEFLEVVNPRLSLLKLKHMGVIPADVKTAIESANDEDAKFVLFEHLQRHATVDTLRIYCDVAIAANGFPRMQKLGIKIMAALSPGGPEENDPPLSQTQVQFPIIDDLADDFALLMVVIDVKRELRSLSDSRLQDVKELVEEKLKSKGKSITIPSSAAKLISTISKYWNCLSFELAQLVIRYLGKKDLQAQLKRYEENLRRKGEILLTQCRGSNIAPRVPPACFSMKITVDEDPYSFSLHRILEFKDFLVHRIGMNIAFFTGWHSGSIILHFCILEGDKETAVRLLYAHKLELRAMQVVAIEVGDVMVYYDAPIERPPSIADCAVYRSTFSMEKELAFLEGAVKITGTVLPVLFEFGSEMKVLAEKVMAVFAEVDDEEIKQMHSVKTALYKLLSVLDCAYAFLDKVDDVFYYCQSDTMKAAREGLALSPPDLKPLRDLMGQLGNSLAQAQHKYAEFVSACNEATHSCGEAEMACARKEREYRNKKKTTKGVAGAAAGAALVGGTATATGGVVATGIVASAVAGVFTLGIGALVGLGITAAAATAVGVAGTAAGVTTAVATHYVASKYAKSEAAFRRIRNEFDTLNSFGYDLNQRVDEVHTALENISAQMDSICYGVLHNSTTTLIKDSVKRLNTVCTASYGNTSRLRVEVKAKVEDLKAKFKMYTN